MSQDLYLNRIHKLYSAQQVSSNALPSQAKTRTKWSKIKNRPLLAWKKTKARSETWVIHFSNHCSKMYLVQMRMAWLVVLRWDSWYRGLYIIPHKNPRLYSYVKRETDCITVSIFFGGMQQGGHKQDRANPFCSVIYLGIYQLLNSRHISGNP